MIIAYFSLFLAGLVVVLVGGMSCDRWSATNIFIHLPPCICIPSSFQCCRSEWPAHFKALEWLDFRRYGNVVDFPLR